MPRVIVNGQELELEPGERINGIEAAARLGIEIPHYCWHAGLTVVASCRMCLVETGKVDPETGDIRMLPKLVPACQTPASDGTVFVTDSEKVSEARATVEEDLLLRHPVDCPICDKAGECRLQDYHFEYGRERRRADVKPFHSRKRELGDSVRLFVDRCVMCTRCVRFCREVAGTAELFVRERGAHEEIDIFEGFPLANELSGNVVDLCPVGALADREFLYQQRVWFMKPRAHVCGGCATGCSIWVDQNQDRIYRLRPRENAHINRWWMCDEGRHGWTYLHDAARRTQPQRRVDESLAPADWETIDRLLIERFGASERPTIVVSPMWTVEETCLAVEWFESLAGGATYVIGPVPGGGDDIRFPKGRRGSNDAEPVFTISGEKCPNRSGVERVVEALTGSRPMPWPAWLSSLDAAAADAVWIGGGYSASPFEPEETERLEAVPFVVVQDLFAGALDRIADITLPAVAFPEREGSFVNRDGWLQSFEMAVRPPMGTRSAGQVFWKLLRRSGLFRAESVLRELAKEQASFAAAMPPVAETGVRLEQAEQPAVVS